MWPQVLGLAVGVSWFVIALALLELITIVGRRHMSPDVHPDALFALGIGPTIGALAFVIGLYLPAQWKLEPPQVGESINLTVITLALVAMSILGTTVFQAGRAVLLTRRLVSAWMLHARRSRAHGPLPVFVIEDTFPLAILVGVTAPRILIARCLFEQLSVCELHAVVAHELAHQLRRDNFKRLLTQSSAVEPMCSALHHSAPVAERIRRLLSLEGPPEHNPSLTLRLGLVSSAFACIAAYPSALSIVHQATEWLLHVLP